MENIQTGYAYLEAHNLFLAVSINTRELSPEIIRAHNYCQEFNALSVKLNARHLTLGSEVLNVSISNDFVDAITTKTSTTNFEIEVLNNGTTVLRFLDDQFIDGDLIVLFDGFEAYDSDMECQPVKFAQLTTNLVAFTWNHLIKKEGNCVICGTDREEVIKEIIASTGGKLNPMQMRELHESAMDELATGLTVAQAVAEATLQIEA
ncbi:MAG: hypothetical protein K0U21_03505 [Proteobacteria bacterium]|nr:hypothetical protein [Pseudomonadota bacterium]